ncbi:MAG TPA: ABC transporter permease [Ktedonobacteraceae bacterium]|nr:ABC transporter permease [Ktedonobacteraceae bacterium]
MKPTASRVPARPSAQAELITRPPRPLARATTRPKYRRLRGAASLYSNCVSALKSLRANKMRSLLTSLGIIIGVGAVIVMISISEASAASINSRLSGLNPSELVIRSGSTGGFGGGAVRGGAGSLQTLTQADADALASLPHVAAVSPVLNVSGQVVFQNQNWSTQTQGVYPSYQQIGSWEMQEGNFFASNSGAYAVIGQTVVSNLFTPLGVDPLGQTIRIGRVSFTVVGVLASKGGSSFGNADDVIFVPFTTAQQELSGKSSVNSIDITADSTSSVSSVQSEVQQMLEQRHHISSSSNDDFTIQNQSQILQTVQATNQTLTVLLVGVASISLVVGGIGIMNIMLVSVTERTREIGIRMAIGARPSDVMTQFLIEAIMLSTLGGLVGILLGAGGGLAYSFFTGSAFALSPVAVLLAFGFAGAVGIIFGFYPARRAARLDPIVALRTE